jgi:hypothetical protein
MHNKDNKNTCMACSCPCDMHKEHNHPTEGEKSEAKVCKMCGHEYKADGSCDCGCQ